MLGGAEGLEQHRGLAGARLTAHEPHPGRGTEHGFLGGFEPEGVVADEVAGGELGPRLGAVGVERVVGVVVVTHGAYDGLVGPERVPRLGEGPRALRGPPEVVLMPVIAPKVAA